MNGREWPGTGELRVDGAQRRNAKGSNVPGRVRIVPGCQVPQTGGDQNLLHALALNVEEARVHEPVSDVASSAVVDGVDGVADDRRGADLIDPIEHLIVDVSDARTLGHSPKELLDADQREIRSDGVLVLPVRGAPGSDELLQRAPWRKTGDGNGRDLGAEQLVHDAVALFGHRPRMRCRRDDVRQRRMDQRLKNGRRDDWRRDVVDAVHGDLLGEPNEATANPERPLARYSRQHVAGEGSAVEHAGREESGGEPFIQGAPILQRRSEAQTACVGIACDGGGYEAPGPREETVQRDLTQRISDELADEGVEVAAQARRALRAQGRFLERGVERVALQQEFLDDRVLEARRACTGEAIHLVIERGPIGSERDRLGVEERHRTWDDDGSRDDCAPDRAPHRRSVCAEAGVEGGRDGGMEDVRHGGVEGGALYSAARVRPGARAASCCSKHQEVSQAPPGIGSRRCQGSRTTMKLVDLPGSCEDGPPPSTVVT
ncbi:MAG: hypothetical protein ACRELB_15900 [Polyangiaceae bacterium]